jgi:hypothetical protein
MKWNRLYRLTLLLMCALFAASAALAQDATEEPTGAVQPTAVPQAQPQQPGPGREIQIGTAVQGTLSPESPTVVYNFVAQAGTIVTIDMQSSEVDSYVRLGDQRGNQLLYDDDGGDDLDARIGPVRLNEDGAYVVIASSFRNAVSEGVEVETGSFTVTVTAYEPEEITYPNTIEGTLGGNEVMHLYSFEGRMGDVLRISLDSADFDPLLLLSPANNLNSAILRDDDSGPDLNALIVPYVIPANGSYLLTAVSVDGNVGDYTLDISRQEPTPITSGEPLSLTLSRDEQAAGVFSYTAGEGEIVDIIVESPTELDTTLTVLGPDGSQVGFNDDTSGRNPALLALALPGAGNYTLIVQPFRRGNGGDITVQIGEAAPATPAP